MIIGQMKIVKQHAKNYIKTPLLLTIALAKNVNKELFGWMMQNVQVQKLSQKNAGMQILDFQIAILEINA